MFATMHKINWARRVLQQNNLKKVQKTWRKQMNFLDGGGVGYSYLPHIYRP